MIDIVDIVSINLIQSNVLDLFQNTETGCVKGP